MDVRCSWLHCFKAQSHFSPFLFPFCLLVISGNVQLTDILFSSPLIEHVYIQPGLLDAWSWSFAYFFYGSILLKPFSIFILTGSITAHNVVFSDMLLFVCDRWVALTKQLLIASLLLLKWPNIFVLELLGDGVLFLSLASSLRSLFGYYG